MMVFDRAQLVAQRLLMAVVILLGHGVAIFSQETDDRAAVPDAVAQKEAVALIRDVYKQEYEAANTSPLKLDLANKLIAEAGDAEEDPASHFVMLRVARDLAAQAGETEAAFEAIDELDAAFQIDGLEMKAAAITKLAKSARLSTQRKALATAAAELIDEALAADDYEKAKQFADTALAAARKARDSKLIKTIAARKKETQRAAEAHAQVQDALTTLDEDPADPPANLAAGRYYCFIKSDWEKGVPYLALGNDSALKALAITELKGVDSPAEQVKLGDGWWDLAQAKKAPEKDSLLSRAGYWYEQAAPNLTSVLLKRKLAQRLDEIAELDLPAANLADPRKARRFDPATAQLQRTLKGHTDPVSSVAFSPDGSTLASASRDKTIKLWKVPRGRLQKTLDGGAEMLWCVAFSPNGSMLAWGGNHTAVKFWNPVAGMLPRTLTGHSNGVSRIAFSSDGSALASGGFAGTIRVWDLTTGRRRKTLSMSSKERSPTPIAFCANRPLLAVGGSRLMLWDLDSGKIRFPQQRSTQTVTCVAFSPSGSFLAAAGKDDAVRLWEMSEEKFQRTLQGHAGQINSVAFSADGVTLASASNDSTVKLWEVASGRLLRTLEGHTGGVQAVAFSPDGALLAVADGNTVKLWGSTSSARRSKVRSSTSGNVPKHSTTRAADSANQLGSLRKWKAGDFECELYRWKNGSPSVKMIPQEDGFCFLSALTGRFSGWGESVEIAANTDGAWHLQGRSKQRELGAEALGVKLPPGLKVELGKHSWQTGRPATKMIHRDEGFCVLRRFSGTMSRSLDTMEIRLGEDGFWYLSGQGPSKPDSLEATSVRFVPPQSVEIEQKQYSWTSGIPPVRMIHKKTGFCFLSGFAGPLQGYKTLVGVSLGQDDYWYLGGQSDKPLAAKAISIRLKKKSR